MRVLVPIILALALSACNAGYQAPNARYNLVVIYADMDASAERSKLLTDDTLLNEMDQWRALLEDAFNDVCEPEEVR